MKSTAHFKGHSIHPMIIPFPIAFFTGTFISDLLFLFTDNSNFFITASYLNIAGVVFALLAAVPGVIDFFYTVPPKSSGKKRAAKHGIINIIVVVIFIVAYILRKGENPDLIVLSVLGLTGVSGLIVSGWMGGTLVYRNQIGVDPRTANAGKWKELYLDVKDGKIEFNEPVDLKADQMILLHANKKRIVLAQSEGKLLAFDDYCTHRGGSLAGGMIICGTVQCPWHGSQFDVYSGQVKAGPAKEKINTYRLSQSNGTITIHI